MAAVAALGGVFGLSFFTFFIYRRFTRRNNDASPQASQDENVPIFAK
jgi:hypothetical protein